MTAPESRERVEKNRREASTEEVTSILALVEVEQYAFSISVPSISEYAKTELEIQGYTVTSGDPSTVAW